MVQAGITFNFNRCGEDGILIISEGGCRSLVQLKWVSDKAATPTSQAFRRLIHGVATARTVAIASE